jgi:predicted DNA-binding antitoxin AbrB/MazE fold protein
MPQRQFRARYANGVPTPLEPLDLSEGREAIVDRSAEDDSLNTTSPGEAAKPSVLAVVDEMHRRFPNTFTGMPHDGAKSYKHYRYGHPRDTD